MPVTGFDFASAINNPTKTESLISHKQSKNEIKLFNRNTDVAIDERKRT